MKFKNFLLLTSFMIFTISLTSCDLHKPSLSVDSSVNSAKESSEDTENSVSSEQEINVTSKTLIIESKPTKVEYLEGEILDTTGLKVQQKIEYSSGDSKIEEVSDFELSIANGTVLDSSYLKGEELKTIDVTVTYTKEAIKTSFAIILKSASYALEVKTLPTKLEYKVGEVFDSTGLVVNLVNTIAGTSNKVATDAYTLVHNEISLTNYTFVKEDVSNEFVVTIVANDTKYGTSTFNITIVAENKNKIPDELLTNITTKSISGRDVDGYGYVLRINFNADYTGKYKWFDGYDWFDPSSFTWTYNSETLTFAITVTDLVSGADTLVTVTSNEKYDTFSCITDYNGTKTNFELPLVDRDSF